MPAGTTLVSKMDAIGGDAHKADELVVDSDPEHGKIYKGRISHGRLKLDGCIATLWDGEPVDFYTD